MKILLNFLHDDEASEANWHKDKRIINWQPFMHSAYIKGIIIMIIIIII